MKSLLHFVLVSLFTAIATFVVSQDVETEWVFSMKDSLPQGDQVVGRDSYIDEIGNKYICGLFKKITDFDPSQNVANLSPTNQNGEIFLTKYDAEGNFLWVKRIGGTLYNESYAITGNNNEIYISGAFEGTTDFDPSPNVTELTSNGSEDVFLAKYDSQGNLIWVNQYGSTVQDRGIDLICSDEGDVFLTGLYSGSVNFGTLASPINLVSNGNYDIFLLKCTPAGLTSWAIGMGTGSYDTPKNLIINSQGNILVSGTYSGIIDLDPSTNSVTLNSSTNGPSFISKYDLNGGYLWSQGLKGTLQSFDVSASNGIYVAGDFNGTVDFDPSSNTANLTSAGLSDMFFAKYDTLGNYIWAKRKGGNGLDHINQIKLDINQNIYIIGDFESSGVGFDTMYSVVGNATNQGGKDFFVAKYDSLGNYKWKNSLGSTLYDLGIGINFDTDSNVFCIGQFTKQVDADPSFNEVLLFSNFFCGLMNTYASNEGDLISAKCFNNYELGWFQEGVKVTNDLDGNIYILGRSEGKLDPDPSSNNAFINLGSSGGAFLAKYDSNGNFIWARGMDGIYPGYNHILIDENNNPILVGVFMGSTDFDATTNLSLFTSAGSSDCFIAKFNPNGGLENAVRFGGYYPEVVTSAAFDNSGNLILTGRFQATVDFDPSELTFNLSSVASTNDIFIAKYTTNGALIWAKKVGGSGEDAINQFTRDAEANIYCTGSFQFTVDFDPSGNTSNLVYSGNTDIFLAKYDTDGNFLWAKKIGGPNPDAGYLIEINQDNELITFGVFKGTIDFDPSATTQNLVSATTDYYLAKYDNDGNYIWAKNFNMPSTGASFGAVKICIDSLQNICLFGEYWGNIDFDLSTTSNIIPSGGMYVSYIAKYESNSDLIWIRRFGSNQGETSVNDAIILDDGSVIMTGGVEAFACLENDTSNSVSSLNYRDPYVLKLSDCLPDLGSFSYTACDTLFCTANNQYYTESGIYNTTTACGSNLTLNITINHSSSYSESISTCDAVVWNGQTYTESGIYHAYFDNSSGCDSIATLNLTILNSSSGVDTQVTCDSLTWIDGVTYTESTNSPTWILPNAIGCDSIVTLDLTVNNSSTYTDTHVACGSFTWIDGLTYTNSNTTATWEPASVNGCDSIIHLNLTIHPIPNAVAIDNGDGTITASGTGNYQWINCNNNSEIVGATGVTFVPTTNGNYAVIADNGNCSDTSNCVIINNVGFSEVDELSLTLLPNPTNDLVQIVFNETEALLIIYDAQGKLIKQKTVYSGEYLSLKDVETGVYFFELTIRNKKSIHRLIKN